MMNYTNCNRTGYNFSTCIHYSDCFFDYADLPWVRALFSTLYSLILLLGLLANSATLRCLLTVNNRVTAQLGVNRQFLINLTVADLLITVTSLPTAAVQTFSRAWLFGEYLCWYAPLIQGASFYVTSFSIMAIAVERYLLITRERRKACRLAHPLAMTLIWIGGFAASVPLSLSMRLVQHCFGENVCLCGLYCDEMEWIDHGNKPYSMAAFFVQFALPAGVLTFCYYRVRQRVVCSVRKRLQRENVSLVSRQRLSKRKNRTAYMTILLFVGFVVPWLPFNVVNLLRDTKIIPHEWLTVICAAAHIMAMTSLLWNPTVYCWANKNFRSDFRSVLFCRGAEWSMSTCGDNGDVFDEADLGETATAGRASVASGHVSERKTCSFRLHASSCSSRHGSRSSRRSRLATFSNGTRPKAALHGDAQTLMPEKNEPL